jgi:hypothetical protein
VTKNRSQSTLRIYVGKHCWSCKETVRLAEEAKARFADLNVELIDLDAEGSVNVDNVFSVPTFVLNGRTLSLGNPASDQFFSQLSEALA